MASIKSSLQQKIYSTEISMFPRYPVGPFTIIFISNVI